MISALGIELKSLVSQLYVHIANLIAESDVR